jgi:hypothetical protein
LFREDLFTKFIPAGLLLAGVLFRVSKIRAFDAIEFQAKIPDMQFCVKMELNSIFAYFCKNGIL